MKVAAIQMVSGVTVQGNLDSARTLLEEAAPAS
jgi:predicted amidohydrolase